jgi:hypothetical protein
MSLENYECIKCNQKLTEDTSEIFWKNHKPIKDVYDYLKVWDLEFMPTNERRFEQFKVWCVNK